jgi:hypothetical protein
MLSSAFEGCLGEIQAQQVEAAPLPGDRIDQANHEVDGEELGRGGLRQLNGRL